MGNKGGKGKKKNPTELTEVQNSTASSIFVYLFQ